MLIAELLLNVVESYKVVESETRDKKNVLSLSDDLQQY